MGRATVRITSGRDGSRGWGTDKDKVGPGRVVALVADSGAKSLNFVVADETLSAHQEEVTTRTELLSKLVRTTVRLTVVKVDEEGVCAIGQLQCTRSVAWVRDSHTGLQLVYRRKCCLPPASRIGSSRHDHQLLDGRLCSICTPNRTSITTEVGTRRRERSGEQARGVQMCLLPSSNWTRYGFVPLTTSSMPNP